jgi:hypothetical protein
MKAFLEVRGDFLDCLKVARNSLALHKGEARCGYEGRFACRLLCYPRFHYNCIIFLEKYIQPDPPGKQITKSFIFCECTLTVTVIQSRFGTTLVHWQPGANSALSRHAGNPPRKRNVPLFLRSITVHFKLSGTHCTQRRSYAPATFSLLTPSPLHPSPLPSLRFEITFRHSFKFGRVRNGQKFNERRLDGGGEIFLEVCDATADDRAFTDANLN